MKLDPLRYSKERLEAWRQKPVLGYLCHWPQRRDQNKLWSLHKMECHDTGSSKCKSKPGKKLTLQHHVRGCRDSHFGTKKWWEEAQKSLRYNSEFMLTQIYSPVTQIFRPIEPQTVNFVWCGLASSSLVNVNSGPLWRSVSYILGFQENSHN